MPHRAPTPVSSPRPNGRVRVWPVAVVKVLPEVALCPAAVPCTRAE